MFVKENNNNLNYVFHYTKKENLEKILHDKEIKTFNDEYTFFTTSYEDSCKLFKELMMKKINYINNKLALQKREIQNPNDYAILKIKISNNNNFYKFVCEANGFNPYNYSILHKGNLKFDKFEILEINTVAPEEKVLSKNFFANYYYGIKKLAVTASISALLLFGCMRTVNATSWEDSNSYTTSWYNPSNSSFNISNANDLAGLVHLVNDENVTFQGKVINILSDIDTTQYTWKKISANFKGTIEGFHKICIALDNNDSFISTESTAVISGITVINNYVIDTTISSNATLEPSGKILVKENEDKSIKVTANTGYEITDVTIDNIKQTVSNNLEFLYTFENVTKPHKVNVKTEKKYTHIKNMQNNILHTSNKVQTNNYSQANPFDTSYTEVVDDVTYLYTYKNCSIADSIYTWNYEASIVQQEYTVIDGANQDYNNKDLIIKFSGNSSKFVKLYINSKEVEKENYTVKTGSTIIILKDIFLKTLPEGNYNIKAEYKDGSVETIFKIPKLNAEKDKATPATSSETLPQVDYKNNESEKDETPKTGNNTNSLYQIIVAIISIAFYKIIKH